MAVVTVQPSRFKPPLSVVCSPFASPRPFSVIMKKFFSALALSLGLAAGTLSAMNAAHASPAAPVAGTDYTVLQAAQPVDAQGKIEVIEFMWYGCPHCNEFDPYLEAWIKKQGPDVVFKRVPVAFRDDFIPHSKMYHALDALGLRSEERRVG